MLVYGSAIAQHRVFEEGRFHQLPYRFLRPVNFDKSVRYPVVLFLHGRGERGHDNEKQLVHGSKLFLDSLIKYPSLVIFPQCPSDGYWSNVSIEKDSIGNRMFLFQENGDPTRSMQLLLDLMDSVENLQWVEKKRIYVLGLSMGGMGTLELIRRKPETFAAAISICGGANPVTAKIFAKHVPLWVFHGGNDDVIAPTYSEKMVEAIRNEGGEVKFTLYPEANHNSWDSAFAETQLMSWLFSNSK
jgi:predicted peptidase